METNLQGHIPIYRKLFRFYQQRIISQYYKPGSRIDSINKIMERHKVSRETAKRVLQMLVDDGLVLKKAGKGTFVRMSSIQQRAWGMAVPFYSSNIEKLIHNVQQEAKNLGRSFQYFLHYNNAEEEIRIVGSLILQGYEAVIIVPNYDETKTAEFYRNLMSGLTKIVLADNTMAGSYFNYVIQSYDLGVKRAVDYLGNKKTGNFLLLGTERWQGVNLVFELMKNTFQIMIMEHFSTRQLFTVNHLATLNADFFKKNNITGILSTSDVETIKIIGRLKQWGFKIPQHVSVVSYGNTELTRYSSPPVTAIDCCYPRMASDIAQQIINPRKRQNDQVVLQPRLIERNT